jgi:hypothetical protein
MQQAAPARLLLPEGNMRNLFAMLLLVGCAGAGGKLRAKAAVDFKCDAETISTEGVQGWAYFEKAYGCGKQNWYVYDGQEWVSPLDRAAFELSCPSEHMTAMAIDKTTIGVTGCNRRAVYVLVPSIGGAKWVLNSTETADRR